VLHVSVHTFTPRWRNARRDVDVALLYDPARRRERAFADAWLEALAARRPDLRLRRNFPYRGEADGLTTHLRGVFGAGHYLGLELEVSQQHALGAASAWRRLQADICAALDVARSAASTGAPLEGR
jgi:predicted N-formylglutamate amidohydrolase